ATGCFARTKGRLRIPEGAIAEGLFGYARRVKLRTLSSLSFSLSLTSLVALGCSGEGSSIEGAGGASSGDPPSTGEVAAPIIGGVLDTGAKAHDSVVMLAFDQYICSGTLIAANVVLTARHCVAENLTEGSLCDIDGKNLSQGADFGPLTGKGK